MDLAIYYIGQAISGTGQTEKAEVDTNKLKTWLIRFAKIAMGSSWQKWLRDINLGTQEDIEAAVVEYLEITVRRGDIDA